MSLPIPKQDQLDELEWMSLIHFLRDYQQSQEDDDEFEFWDVVIDKLYAIQRLQFQQKDESNQKSAS